MRIVTSEFWKKMEVGFQPSVPEEDSNHVDRPCYFCKKLCNKRTRTGRQVTASHCLSYDVPETDLHPDTLICLTCYFKHLKIKTGRKSNAKKQHVGEIAKGDKTVVKCTGTAGTVFGASDTGKTLSDKNCEPESSAVHANEVLNIKKEQSVCSVMKSSDPVTDIMKGSEPVTDTLKSSEPVCDVTNSSEPAMDKKGNDPITDEIKGSKPVPNEIKGSDPVPDEIKGSEPVPDEIKGSEPVPNEIKGSEPVPNEIKGSEPVPNEIKGRDPVSADEVKMKCASVMCEGTDDSKICSFMPGRFFTFPPDVKQSVKSQYGIIDERKKFCKRCYKKLYRTCLKLGVFNNKIEIRSYTERQQSKYHSNTCGIVRGSRATKTYACGWCKFRSGHYSSVVKHHYKEHQMRELDIVSLGSSIPKLRSRAGIGFSSEFCDSPSKHHNLLHKHNKQHHKNLSKRDSVATCESNAEHSPVYPYFDYNKTLPSSYIQMQQRYNLKEVKIICEDIFKSGLENLIRRANDEGISKLCVDSLTEDEFVSMATVYRKDISYCDSRVEDYIPVDLGPLELQEIESVIRN